ncbi:uncharacterized protein LOC117343973 isoform X2 [Pecten maximus]|uniref:uncharacterized protein LOC117343973 isoform X2 n=1 Tax=Pecten maximus TaxID=6579 RepID=UPI0014583C26|nr:uncharacterized protein LOC117343973 isoform X2 [Pecten maximus]
MAEQSVDDVIVCLMSMGFDWQDAQDAIQSGKISVENAVEWLIAGKPGFQKVSEGVPSLKLRQDGSEFEEGSNPFVSSASRPLDPASIEEQEVSPSDAQGQSSVHDETQSVLSRLHLSEEQRKAKQRFEMKQMDEARQAALKDKQRRKRDHARVLKEIADDREKQKMFHQGGGTSETAATEKSPSPGQDSVPVEKTPAPTTSTSSGGKCLLQIRMTDGGSVRQSFPASAGLKEVWQFVQTHQKKSLTGMCLIQPFPHREFGEADMDMSLQDLGLTPSGSLVLRKTEKKDTTTKVTDSSEMDTEESESATGSNKFSNLTYGTPGAKGGSTGLRSHGSQAPPPMLPPTFGVDVGGSGGGFGGPQNLPAGMPQMPPIVGMNPLGMPDIVPGPSQSWGQGHVLGQDDDQPVVPNLDGAEPEEDADSDEGPDVVQGLGQFGHGFGGGGGGAGGLPWGNDLGMGFGGGAHMHADEAFQGVGQRLVPEGHPHQEENQNKSAREMASQKARERYAQPVAAPSPPENQGEAASPALFTVQPLFSNCLCHVSRRLKDPRSHLHSLGGLSEDLAQRLLEYLIKNKLLSSKILNAFIPCYLRKVILDCYPYTSNELLMSVRFHTHLAHLSLRSCTLITDAGLKPLIVLKKLKHLDLSSCKQISNKCLAVVSEFKCLTALSLEETGVTDSGMIEYLTSCPSCLQHLNLNKTQVTEKLLPYLKDLPALKSLYLEHTQVSGLSGVQDLKQLETLDVAHTSIVTDSMLCVCHSKTLQCLGISHTENINGDQALRYIKDLRLHALNLPSRVTTTDTGMSFITNFQLTTLDLTNYINIGDDGMSHVGRISSLRRLLLANTKVTDQGMMFLEGLTNLEVLYLDKTNVSDQGAVVIKSFGGLRELSLSSTCVTSEFLKEGTLNRCINLTKVNLSRTGVTERGVQCIQMPSLVLLNLDGTRVRPSIDETLHVSCPTLKKVTLSNLLPYNPNEDED